MRTIEGTARSMGITVQK
ncbi:hypothetical protein [Bacillus cereus]